MTKIRVADSWVTVRGGYRPWTVSVGDMGKVSEGKDQATAMRSRLPRISRFEVHSDLAYLVLLAPILVRNPDRCLINRKVRFRFAQPGICSFSCFLALSLSRSRLHASSVSNPSNLTTCTLPSSMPLDNDNDQHSTDTTPNTPKPLFRAHRKSRKGCANCKARRVKVHLPQTYIRSISTACKPFLRVQ